MKFKHMLYGKNEEIPLILSESMIDRMAKDAIGRKLNKKEIKYLAEKSIGAIYNLIVKIGSSGMMK